MEERNCSCLMDKDAIIPIHRKGKNKSDPKSYRPISLLSCLGKLLERVINRRLISFLEEQKLLSPTQTGYRKHKRSACPHCAGDRECLSRKEKGCFCFPRHDKSFWQSLAWRSPAEDTWERRFWKNVQMDAMLPTRHISKSKAGWAYEQKREHVRRRPTGRSHLTDTLSPVQQHHDCASPICLQHPTCRWSRRVECIWIHHILCLQNPGSCEHGTTVDEWLPWGLQINEVKTQATVFSLSTSKEKVTIKPGNKTLPQVETPTFFGVKVDTRLSRKPHIEDMETKSIKKFAVLKKLSGTHWGANSKILKTVYLGAVRLSLEYLWGQSLGDSSQYAHQ